MHSQPRVDRVDLLDGYSKKVLDKKGMPVQLRQYHFEAKNGKTVVLQEHSLGHEKATPLHGAEPHFNVRPITNLNTGSIPGTHGHYNF
ncbi:HNH/endonuclease VII fold putative polymorphic toxin, partial [Pantoea sp. KXB25]|uniref:HNH/endonuclease VII fold putative polymorphic toxin n=1 Tax=Pantoea sp. KXB25 TaxID=3402308 RepID=UPI003AB1478A